MKLHGTDDGYFYVDSGHRGLGINKEALKLLKKNQELQAEIDRQRKSVAAPAPVAYQKWLLWGGAAVAVLALATVMLKKRKGSAA